ncbi:family 78 glycoside hydrolase catalytic domain [Maribacter sp. X9]|uniref:family 78 glycoside hydrolase catalytic domain n=1 Tax=Maribacter sp. X9 TaxID=3402159 RepID=UPI003AF38D1A
MFRNLLILLVLTCQSTEKISSELLPTQLTCEYLKNPAVIDIKNPQLAWISIDPKHERGQAQSAYQIRVASSQQKLDAPDLWDSGKIRSSKSIGIRYAGKKLNSRQECWWQVRVWDKNGDFSKWSDISTWRMGLLNKSDWQAKWIGAPWQSEEAFPKPSGGPNAIPKDFGPPAPFLRKSFQLKKELSKAVAYVTGLGYFEFYANGIKVSDDVLVPNQTNYGKRPNLSNSLINVEDNFSKYKVMYLAYDITKYLNRGENVVGSILGNGFYNPAKFWTEGYGSPRFIGQIHLTYTDGSEEVIVSDESWKVSQGPILMNMVYYGETYDARKEIKDWASPKLNDLAWSNAITRKAPEGTLVAHAANTDKVMERIQPISIIKISEGRYKVDFGVEISGWVKLNDVTGPAGHKIDITFNGNLYSGENSYILKGEGKETYAPRFNWFVFSGVEINNWPGELKASHLTAEAVNTFIEESATFETSNQLLNDITKIWKRSLVDNMHGGIVSDCPHRERSAYTGDGQVACSMVMQSYDAKNFYYKWIQDILDAQNIDTGYVPNAAPWQPGCGGGVAWGAAVSIMPWEFYVNYGDTELLEMSYEPMKKYIEYMKTWVNDRGLMHSQRRGSNGEVVKWFNLGEWESPGELLREDLVHTFYFWKCLDIATKTAKVLKKNEEYFKYKNLAESTRNTFHKAFYNAQKGSYGDGGGNILALKMGVTQEQYEKVKNALIKNVENNKGHLDTGIYGTRYFFEVLAENGLNNLAYNAINKTDEPSFGYWLSLGSTTTRESWDNSGSHNHPMFGGGLVWMYRNLAGMKSDPDLPAFKHIIFKPQPIDELTNVAYKNNTPYGQAGIHWKKDNGDLDISITVPVGSTATVYIPVYENSVVLEGGKVPLGDSKVVFLERENDYEVYKIESGEYNFKSEVR